MAVQNKTQVGNSWVKSPAFEEKDIIQEYDSSADNYDEASEGWDYRGAIDGARFFRDLVSADTTTLDAGCGTGLVGHELHALGMVNLHGIDLSASMLKIAKDRNIYTGQLVAGNICKTPFEDDAFDALISIAVLTHFPEIEPAFREFERIIKPGGLIAFSHRVDLEKKCGFDDALSTRLLNSRWSIESVTKPQPYYPQKADYTDKILIRYHAYRC